MTFNTSSYSLQFLSELNLQHFSHDRLKKSFSLLRIDKWYLVNPRRKGGGFYMRVPNVLSLAYAGRRKPVFILHCTGWKVQISRKGKKTFSTVIIKIY